MYKNERKFKIYKWRVMNYRITKTKHKQNLHAVTLTVYMDNGKRNTKHPNKHRKHFTFILEIESLIHCLQGLQQQNKKMKL